jgi:hypothetical protein
MAAIQRQNLDAFDGISSRSNLLLFNGVLGQSSLLAAKAKKLESGF